MDDVKFGRYLYEWDRQEFLLYFVQGLSQGLFTSHYFILCEASPEDSDLVYSKPIDRLMYAAASWAMAPEDEILVFNHRR